MKHLRLFVRFSVLLLIAIFLPLPAARPIQAEATSGPYSVYLPVITNRSDPIASPALQDFIQTVAGEPEDVIQGVYVDQVLALKVVQQPADNPYYVDPGAEVVTQFGLAAPFGTTGLLAHNDRAGSLFSDLAPGQEVILVFGDQSVRRFQIQSILEFQAVQPTSPFSTFIDLASGETLSASTLFERVYTGPEHVTFQTCIARDGQSAWGRLFVIAYPVE